MKTLPNNFGQGTQVLDADEVIVSEGFTGVSASGLLAPSMVQRTLGAGMAITQAISNFLLTTGTTTNSEFLARSKESFDGVWTARMKHILSQRIVNNNFLLMLADSFGESLAVTINSATSITVTKVAHNLTAANVGQSMFVGAIVGAAGVPGRYAIATIVDNDNFTMTVAGWPASGSCVADLFGYNHVKVAYSGATATQALFDTQRAGWLNGDTTLTVNTTASPGHVIQFHNDGRNVYVEDSLAASSTALAFTTRGSRVDHIPGDTTDLYLYMWAYNGTTAPASTTTWTVAYWSIETFPNKPMFIAGTRQIGQAAPQPVAVIGSPTLAPLPASTNQIGDVGIQYRATATGAATIKHLISAATTNLTSTKASAGRLIGWKIANTNAAYRYVKMHNTAGAPTAGSGVVMTIAVPPNSSVSDHYEGGIGFSTGIAFSTVTGSADADTAAVGAGDLIIDLFYA
jgi:hypothetical protein